MSWPIVKLEQVASVKGGKRLPKGHDFSELPTPHPYIRARDIGCNRITFSEPVYINDHTFRRINNYTVSEGDLVITIVGANIGDIGYVTSEFDGANLTENAAKLHVNRTLCDSKFLSFQLSTRRMKEKFQLLTGGSAQGKLGLYKIKSFDVVLPPLEIQENIVRILSVYDDLIENNRQRIQLLEQSARLLYKEWFVHLRYPGHEHIKIKDGVPEGWEKKPLSELCTDIRESVDPKTLHPDTAYIGLEHIPRRCITLYDWGIAAEVNSNKFKFAEGDILFGKIRPYFHKVGFTLLDGITSSDAIVIRSKESQLYHFLLFLLSSGEFVALASKTVREGSKMPRADWKFLLKMKFTTPSLPILHLFNEATMPICSQLRNLALFNRQLAKARDLLLPRLMNGEVAV